MLLFFLLGRRKGIIIISLTILFNPTYISFTEILKKYIHSFIITHTSQQFFLQLVHPCLQVVAPCSRHGYREALSVASVLMSHNLHSGRSEPKRLRLFIFNIPLYYVRILATNFLKNKLTHGGHIYNIFYKALGPVLETYHQIVLLNSSALKKVFSKHKETIYYHNVNKR